MTNNLKCPFCGTELKEWQEWGTPAGLSCPNTCKTRQILDKEIWQALIDGKAAQDALKEIKAICESGRYADTLNFNLDSADIRNIYDVITKQEKGNE